MLNPFVAAGIAVAATRAYDVAKERYRSRHARRDRPARPPVRYNHATESFVKGVDAFDPPPPGTPVPTAPRAMAGPPEFPRALLDG